MNNLLEILKDNLTTEMMRNISKNSLRRNQNTRKKLIQTTEKAVNLIPSFLRVPITIHQALSTKQQIVIPLRILI